LFLKKKEKQCLIIKIQGFRKVTQSNKYYWCIAIVWLMGVNTWQAEEERHSIDYAISISTQKAYSIG
jgi:hypothetical protein